MKKLIFIPLIFAGIVALVSANHLKNKNTYGFEKGTVALKSISALAFGPDGVLFIGDSKSATVFAIDTKDKTAASSVSAIEVKNLDQKIATVLGTEAKNVSILDMVVNPISKKIYCAAQLKDGSTALLLIEKEKITAVPLVDVMYKAASLNNAPVDTTDKNGRSPRDNTISDMQYADGALYVSGLSNQQFKSTFRRIQFPFVTKEEQATTLEIFHAAHGKYETHAPIKTFTTAELNGKKYLVASYTCTPLVLFPLDELKDGQHVKGRTVAEFGAGNSPLDMVTISRGGKNVLLMSNSNRPIMRVRYDNIATYDGSLTEPIKESFSTAGVAFVNLPMVNVLQMDKIDDSKVVVIQRKPNGDLDLVTLQDWILS
ncbi:hypothetical protein [Pollutibacter soli]|uniref:hypothetical protein n=1 Tax=Pollutibacter soli TaxID=3034157 RepID=UPI0030141492